MYVRHKICIFQHKNTYRYVYKKKILVSSHCKSKGMAQESEWVREREKAEIGVFLLVFIFLHINSEWIWNRNYLWNNVLNENVYKISKLLILDNEKSFSLYLIMFFGRKEKKKKKKVLR